MRRLLGRLGWIIAGVVVLAAAGIAIALWVSRPPEAGAFYDPPELAADTAPGTLLRSERMDAGVPEGAEGWRILYATPGLDGEPRAVSGQVIARPGGDDPRSALAWAHGTIGVARGCAPTLMDDPSIVMLRPLGPVLAEGWVVVATDYPGLGTPGPHPYLAGEVTGRSVIDSVRAAGQIDDLGGLDGRYAVWGESQGGHAALWTGIVAAQGYAPELELVGVAAAAPASDIGPLFEAAIGTKPGKILISEAAWAWDRAYPELSFEEAIRPAARPAARVIAERCLFPNIAVVAATTLAVPDNMLAIDIVSDPRWSRRITESTPDGAIDVPVVIAQGDRDPVVAPAVQRAWVRERCAAGQSIDFREVPGAGHADVLGRVGDDLVGWTRDRFAGVAAAAGCPGLPASG
ncbi:MAG: lipase family protein [Thermoleophilia bacterium]